MEPFKQVFKIFCYNCIMNKKNNIKTLLLIVALILSGVRLYAYESNQVALSLGAIYSPLEIGTDYGEVNVDDTTTGESHDTKLGKPGFGGEIQALYFLSPRVGVGLSFSDQYFASDLSSGWYVNNHTRMQNYMVVGHIFLTPNSSYKLYIPLGIGAAHTTYTKDFSSMADRKYHFSYTGFAYHVGIGVEKEIAKHWNLGLEGRYNGNRFHDSATRTNGHHITVYPRANFFSLILRVIYTL